ncbi:MAG: 1-aminocyclopropane-1-carboxylate deaminase/D-cysteine desulfhydrase [Putridiphycobacter sp.]
MFRLPSPIQQINLPLFKQKQVEVFIKRDDLIHPLISGNKWRKLKYNIEKLKANQYDGLLTFGGAFSNHIAATAAAGKLLNIPTIGVIRGDELNSNSNETLRQAHQDGMHLEFVSRSQYAERYERLYHEKLRIQFGNVLIVEEGGANYYGAVGCAEIIKEVEDDFDKIYTASGTGTTAAGLLIGSTNSKIVSVPVLKNGGFIHDEIKGLLRQFMLDEDTLNAKLNLLKLNLDAHFGGYGKFSPDLIQFINNFFRSTGIKLDQIYTGKMMFALAQDIESGKILPGQKILALHTGGVQGLKSIKSQLDFKV